MSPVLRICSAIVSRASTDHGSFRKSLGLLKGCELRIVPYLIFRGPVSNPATVLLVLRHRSFQIPVSHKMSLLRCVKKCRTYFCGKCQSAWDFLKVGYKVRPFKYCNRFKVCYRSVRATVPVLKYVIGCKYPKRNRPSVREGETRHIYPNSTF